MSIQPISKTVLLFLLSVMALASPLSAQFKYEREYVVKERKVPQLAKDFVNSLPLHNKVKWYREEDLDGVSYEGKTWHDDHYFSIEFDSVGVLEDIEEIIEWEEIPTHTALDIKNIISSDLAPYVIEKIQIQYTGELEELFKIFSGQVSNAVLGIAYEVEVRGKTSEDFKLKEYLISQNGELIREAEIIPRNTDNLEY